ncbi:protein abrupt-like [Odontomachus brunneus]|uniref:protein abrupt-like n=1 Tax=Odontomachus brunneus TaxID=486640 RepID=UPI0013F202CE|nr:protein abrupt-like [Odontomachus brunneus]XP_032677217.1 protein abrupt-like [Odontomachus brunneus]XP_032677218.1 protein abrupt-like [Odontomachus brunneus]
MELSSKEFSLKWDNYAETITSGLLSHLNENNLVDVTLAVDGHLITAHKLVLSVCSPYFKNIFKTNPCQHPVIILKDIKQMEIEALLKFMYQGEVNVKREDLPTFLKTAQIFQIKGLEDHEGQIIPMINNYVNASHTQCNAENISTLSDTNSEQRSKRKLSDGSASSQKINKKNTRKRKKYSSENENNLVKQPKDNVNINSNDDIYLLSDDSEKDANDPESENSKYEIENNDSNNGDQEMFALTNQSNSNNLMQSEEVPVTYRLSARGRPQLVHAGYVYNMTSRSEGLNRLHYRCAEQHRGCRGKCAVISETFMPTGVDDHNHPPAYESEYDYRKKKGLDTDNV